MLNLPEVIVTDIKINFEVNWASFHDGYKPCWVLLKAKQQAPSVNANCSRAARIF
jgi:hypothetical protein